MSDKLIKIKKELKDIGSDFSQQVRDVSKKVQKYDAIDKQLDENIKKIINSHNDVHNKAQRLQCKNDHTDAAIEAIENLVKEKSEESTRVFAEYKELQKELVSVKDETDKIMESEISTNIGVAESFRRLNQTYSENNLEAEFKNVEEEFDKTVLKTTEVFHNLKKLEKKFNETPGYVGRNIDSLNEVMNSNGKHEKNIDVALRQCQAEHKNINEKMKTLQRDIDYLCKTHNVDIRDLE